MTLYSDRLAALRAFGPFPALQVVPSRPDGDELVELMTNPVKVALGDAVGALAYHGGPTIAAPKLVALYAGTFYSDRTRNDQFLKELLTYGYLEGFTSQGTGNGTFLGSFDVPDTQTSMTDADCQTLIGAAITANPAIPRPDASTIYMLILPANVTIGDGTPANSGCTGFCGYHSSTAEFLYTVQVATVCNTCNEGNVEAGLQMVEAHEVLETATDPHGTGWYSDQTGMENADECAWTAVAYGPWTVQGGAAENAAGQWVNTVGAYVVPSQPQPQPEPQPFVPDANLVAWLARQIAVAQMAHDAYDKGDFPDAHAAQQDIAHYAAWLDAYLTAVQATAAHAQQGLPDLPAAA